MTVKCQYTASVEKKGKDISEAQYRDISRRDRRALIALCNTLIKPNLDDHLHIKRKMNCYWKQHREALVIRFGT